MANCTNLKTEEYIVNSLIYAPEEEDTLTFMRESHPLTPNMFTIGLA